MSLLPPLKLLRAFESAARHSSVTAASLELNLTHAAVSQQLKQLESWFGRRLFERAGRGIRLTSAGSEFHAVVASALLLVSATAQKLKVETSKSSLTVGCIPSIATRWLIPGLRDFLQQAGNLDVRVQYAHAQQRFDGEAHDVLITFTNMNDAGISSTRLFSRASKPVASAHYVERNKGVKLPGGLETAELLHDESMEAWQDWFKLAGRVRTKPFRGPVYQDFNLLSIAVLSGHGVALCPVEVFRREIARGDLVVLSDIATLEQEGYYIIKALDSTPAASAFASWFEDTCRKAT